MHRFISATMIALALAVPAAAQSVNYGDLESLFGEPVTTSATGKPEKVSQVPVNMDILTQDYIRRSGADSIPEVLHFVAGLDFRRTGINEGDVSIRGYDQPWNPRMLVLVNGRPVYEDFYGDVVWAAFPVQLDEIRQIEIVRGPNSALFGFNAASGVINIVTYDPLQDSGDALTYRTGTQGLQAGSAYGIFHLGDNLGIRLSAGGWFGDEFSRRTTAVENKTFLIDPTSRVVNFDSRWAVANGWLVSLEGNMGKMERNFIADETPENDTTNTVRLRAQGSTAIGTVDLDFYRTEWYINYLGSQAQQGDDIVYDFRASDLFKLGTNHAFRVAFEYKNNSADGQYFNGNTLGYDTYSVSGMWNWQIANGWSFTTALRNDALSLYEKGPINPAENLKASDFNRNLNAFSANLGLVWQPSDYDTIRAMAARGFQLPSIDDLGQQIDLGGGFFDAGNPHLKATQVDNYELDFDHVFAAINTTLRTAAYYQLNTGLFGYDVATVTYGPYTLFQSYNIGSSKLYGGETSLLGTIGAINWNVGYKYNWITDSIPAFYAGVYSAFQKSTPQHVVDFGLGWHPGNFEIDAKARWQSSWTDYYLLQGAYTPQKLSGAFVVNARLGYKFNDHLSAGLSVLQLNRERELLRPELPTERRVIFSITGSY